MNLKAREQKRNRAVRRNYTTLHDALPQPDVASGLTRKLYSGAIITRDAVKTAPTQQANCLLQAMEPSIKIDHTMLRKFTLVLRKQPVPEPIAKRLRQHYRECVSEARLTESSSSGSDTDSTDHEQHQSQGGCPDMMELLSFPSRDGGTINIPQQIGAKYITFGTHLLEDKTQARVTAIANEHNNQAEEINQHLLREWLQGSGTQPVTWDTLAEVLRKVPLNHLAEEIEWHYKGSLWMAAPESLTLEECLRAVPVERLEKICQDDDLPEFSQELSRWPKVSPFLGLSESEEEEFEGRTAKRPRIDILRKWSGSGATYRRLSEALWRAQRVDLVDKLCSLLTSPTSTTASQLQLSTSSYQPNDSHLTRTPVPPLFNQRPLIPHSMTGGPCELRPSTALPTDLPAFNSLSQSPPPSPSNSSSKPGHSNGARPSPLLPQQPGSPAYIPTTVATGASTQLLAYGSYLRSRYQAQVPSFALQWPPPPSTKIFNLAMIKKERVQRGRIDEEDVRLTITGKVDDILHKKVPVKLEKIFKLDEKKRKVILIEGAPGSGKSTLSWDICQRWGAGKLFQGYEAVVLVRIRDPEAQKACEITELLPAQDRSMAESVAAEIVACRGRKVLFVIDGWDEGGSSLPEISAIRRLIQPELCCQENTLYESSVIVTSRPIASGDLQPLASSRIEIVGFTPAELRQYFSECLKGDCRAVDELLERIQEHPEVEGSCYLPLNAAIIVHLFLSEGQTIPSTQYGIFSAVVLNCIFRHLKQRTEEGRQIQCLQSICSLPEAIREPFENLCKLAYRGVVENKITFSQDDFTAVGIPTSVPLLGLLQAVESLVSAGRCVSFNFIHLSIQELLAAFSISRLSSSQQISVFQVLFGEPRFREVFQFYAAITKLQNPGIRSIVTRIIKKEKQDFSPFSHNPHPLLVSLQNCLFEAQDPSLCQFVAEQLNGSLDLHLNILTPLDCLSVGYFLSCVCVTTSGVFRVDLRHCSIDDHKCRFLTRCLCRCPAPNSTATGWLHMDLHGNVIGERGAQHIADVLQNTSMVQILCLGSSMQENGLKCIFESLLTNCSLVTLSLAVPEVALITCSLVLKITQESGPVLCQMLQRNNTLTELVLTRNRGVSDTGAFFIAEGLKLNTSLRTLRLTKCGISAEGAKFISGALESNTSLKVIGLGYNELGDTGVGYLADALKQNDSLKELYLWRCGMTDRGLELLAVALTVNKSLEVLELGRNDGISVGGLPVLTEHLKGNIGLVELHLPVRLKSASRLQDTVNEARRRSGLPLIKVEWSFDEWHPYSSVANLHLL